MNVVIRRFIERNERDLNLFLDKSGLIGSPRREELFKGFWRKGFLGREFHSYDSLSRVKYFFENLNSLLKRKAITINKHLHEYITATDFSSYAFCPASFSIARTFDIPITDEMGEGLEKHETLTFEEYLSKMIRVRFREEINQNKKSEVLEEYRLFYQDMVSANISFRGHTNNASPFFSVDNTICGVPDYILTRKSGIKAIVEEKHSFRDSHHDSSIFKSTLAQALCYIYGLDTLSIEDAYVVIFYWRYRDKTEKKLGMQGVCLASPPKIHHITRSHENENYYYETKEQINFLKNTGEVAFDIDDVPVDKCVGCSLFALCNHKRGDLTKLNYPYRLT